MAILPDNLPVDAESESEPQEREIIAKPHRKFSIDFRKYWIVITLVAFLAGSFGGFGIGRNSAYQEMAATSQKQSLEINALVNEINPADGIKIQATYGDIGPKLLAAGVIDLSSFEELYKQAGQPLSEQEITILTKGNQDKIVFTRENAHFLLNYFWALGLSNKNPVLETGPIQQASGGKIDGFASTGGWAIGTKPINELFSSVSLLSLSPEQQARVEEVAKAVYRPCCDNPTHFPDCNHGMAMLGLLELMASQNATVEEMFQAAKYANAFWYPQQTLEQAVFFKATDNVDYKDIDAKLIVGQQVSSISSFKSMHQWLSENGLLGQTANGGNSCGV